MERWCKDPFGFAAGKMANIALPARCNCVVGAQNVLTEVTNLIDVPL